jgi:hypothetical protein
MHGFHVFSRLIRMILIGVQLAVFGPDRRTKINQAEHVIEPYSVADELCRETVAMVRVWRLLHAIILVQAVADRQLT